MASLAPPDSPSSSRPLRHTKSFARKCERCCCAIATCFPLAFVYSLTTWAAWVEAKLGFMPSVNAWSGVSTSLLGVALYLLLNVSYSIAVFTDPGSPSNNSVSKSSKNGYSHLPTTEPRSQKDHNIATITVSSTGAPRFCKKCLSLKPDRAHHCSTCKRCVLKMDHHCPWLATCVGLHNYKPFLLFLIYSSIFCWVCFAVSAQWLWAEILADEQYLETLMPINVVLLAVIAGIIGIVLTGFTAWHISLACRGITTIECLEKTRYLSPMRKAHQQHLLRQQESQNDPMEADGHTDIPAMLSNTLHKAGEQILNIHANAIPGATRVEEGEEHPSPIPMREPLAYPTEDFENAYDGASSQLTPAQASLARHYRSPASREASLERRRYQEYLDEEFAPKLPHAFNLGWRRNLLHLLGSNPWLWCLPVCNTSGDGWRWEISSEWLDARERVAEERRIEEERVGIRGGHYEQDRGYAGVEERQLYGNGGRSEVGSDLSMRTLSLKGKSSSRADFDRGEAGEIDSFQVSGSSDEDDEDEDLKADRGTNGRSSAGWTRW